MTGAPWHLPEDEAAGLPPGALDGVRVIEFGTILAIPSCGVHLSDMGAEVIKVEPPSGDPHRGPQPIVPTEGKGFIAMNRGKAGICVDMSRPESRPLIARLVESADVVLMSLKPSDLPRFGLTYEELRQVNPRIIYLEHQPFGETGPYGGEGGYDVVVQGMSGVAAMMARASGPAPATVTPAIADMTTGVASALAVVAALLHRERTGEGQRVRSSLLASSILLAGNRTNWFAATDPVPYEPLRDRDRRRARARRGLRGAARHLPQAPLPRRPARREHLLPLLPDEGRHDLARQHQPGDQRPHPPGDRAGRPAHRAGLRPR